MDVKEIKQLKATMEIEIKEMIYEFQTKTGLAVNNIDLIHTTVCGELPPYPVCVKINVKVD